MKNLLKTLLCVTILATILAGCTQNISQPTLTHTLEDLVQTPSISDEVSSVEGSEQALSSIESISLWFDTEEEFVAAVKEAKRSGKKDKANLKGIDFYLRPDNLPQEGYPLYQVWVTTEMIRFTYYKPEDLKGELGIFNAREKGDYFYLDATRWNVEEPLAYLRQTFRETGWSDELIDNKYLLWPKARDETGGEIYWAQEHEIVRIHFADAPNAEGRYDDTEKLISYCGATRIDIKAD